MHSDAAEVTQRVDSLCSFGHGELMFTDDSSPFKPPADSRWTFVVLLIAAIGAFGVYAYVVRMTELNEARTAAPKSVPRSAHVPRPEQSAGSAVPNRFDGGAAGPSISVAASPESVHGRQTSGDASAPTRITIYLCKAYSGGAFWSDTTCSSQRATIDRMTTVPASLSFPQQVAIARGEAQEAAMLYEAPQPIRATAIRSESPAADRPSICDIYDQQVRDLDAEARRPLPAFRQDQIRTYRMNVMSARARERC